MSEDFSTVMVNWARRTTSVEALVLIGSRQRAVSDELWRADSNSDWDFQIISAQPQLFLTSRWTEGLGEFKVQVYAPRMTRIGNVPKVNALFAGAEADFVILPAGILRVLKWLVRVGCHRRSKRLRLALQDLSVVIRPGWKFLHGGVKWDSFYRRVVNDIPDPRLSNEEVNQLAKIFLCEKTWVLHKIERGELVAAQRLLHRELAETNFRLLHELKLRRGERSFPDARRVELVSSESELAKISVSSSLNAKDLRAAVEHSALTCDHLSRSMLDIR